MARRAFLLVIFAALLLTAVGSGTAASAQSALTQPPIAPKRAIDLSKLCSGGNCNAAFASLRSRGSYYLPAGVWTFTKPLRIPSNVSLSGDGIGIAQGTDLVYTGPKTSGAVITAGAPGSDWVNGHIAGLEIETEQLHQWRLHGGSASQASKLDQAGVGLEIVNPTTSSTVDNVGVWTFKNNSILIDNHAASPGSGVFQLSDFFVGGSPHPLEVRGSRAGLLLRFGGIDLGPDSQLGMLFGGDQTGATSVVESVKVEGDYDVPGFVVTGAAPVVFVGATRYLNQSLYVQSPVNSAPAFLYRNPTAPRTNVLQCLGCTALGEQTALALPDLSLTVPTSRWGIDLSRLSAAGASAVAKALATPETPLARPHNVVNLGPLCPAGNCDAALANLRWGGRYYLPAGVWTFSRPFTIPSAATFFGDGPQSADQGGTELRYVGPSIPGDAAIRFGPGGDMSSGRLFSLWIDTTRSLSGGFGLRVINATNASSVEDISISGFPDGQVLVDDGTSVQRFGPGPNFFRIARFSLDGGIHPLEVVGGRQNLLIEQGTINLDSTSQEGVYLRGGEELAVTRVVESVSVTGNYDVPGFRIDSNAAHTFVRSSRTANGVRVTSPGFLYVTVKDPTTTPHPVAECLRCSVSGLQTALAMPALGVSVAATSKLTFDYLNPNAQLQTVRAPFNVGLPAAVGNAVVGQKLTAARGSWTKKPTRYAYQWLRCLAKSANSGNYCKPITGATRPSYAITSADSALFLRVTVAAKNASGTQVATSLPVLVSP